MPHRPIAPVHRARSRTLRSNMKDAERRLWMRLRAHRLGGLSFRRQVPIGPYIVDFASFDARLIIEIDGGQHASAQAKKDRIRDAWLREQGFTIRRYWNNDLFSNLDGVLEDIVSAVKEVPPSLTLPRKGGGDASGFPERAR
jgi:very-short-patch-repair endonuclease